MDLLFKSFPPHDLKSLLLGLWPPIYTLGMLYSLECLAAGRGVPAPSDTVCDVGAVEEGSVPVGQLNFHTCRRSAPQAACWSLAQPVSNLITRKDACDKV